jgi:hypothetical protein
VLSGAPLYPNPTGTNCCPGLDSSGNVIVNDPVGRDKPRAGRIYRRSEFAWAWFCSGSGRVAYLVCPEGSAPDRSYDVVRGSR